jgi:hypothetical protein
MSAIKLTTHVSSQVEERHIQLRPAHVLNELYALGILDEMNPCTTGCWKFDHATGKHVIMLSPMAYHTIATPSLGAGVRKQVPELFKAVYEHEAAHSLYTTKDLKGLNKILQEKKIPWRLLNFRTARSATGPGVLETGPRLAPRGTCEDISWIGS